MLGKESTDTTCIEIRKNLHSQIVDLRTIISENGILSEIIRKEYILGSHEAQLGGGFGVLTLSICSSMQNTAIVHNLLNILDTYSVHC